MSRFYENKMPPSLEGFRLSFRKQLASRFGWGVWTPFDSEDQNPPLIELVDEFHFDFAVLAKGRRQPLYGQALEDYRKRRAAKERQPTPPRIQAILRQAHEFQARLAAAPGLTRAALAREVGISPTRMTMILHLANLAPEILRHLGALPPSIRRPPITERRLRTLARMPDRDAQRAAFLKLMATPDPKEGYASCPPR